MPIHTMHLEWKQTWLHNGKGIQWREEMHVTTLK